MSLRALTWAKQQRVGDPIAKLVLLCLADAMNAHHEYAFPSQARLADECECSRQTVNKKLAWLEEKGFVRRERTKDTTGRDTGCRYHLLGVNDGDTGVNQSDTGVNDGDRGVSTTFTPGVNDGDTSKGNLNINPKREPSQRGTRLTLDHPPADWIAWAEGEGHHDPPDEWLRFRDYWIAQPGQKGVKTDWPATWRNWIRRSLDGKRTHKPNEHLTDFARALRA